MPEINLIDINELAKRLSIPKGTLYNWVYLRRIPFVKLGRALRFDPNEISQLSAFHLHWKWLAGGIQPRISKGTSQSAKRKQIGSDRFRMLLHLSEDP